MLMFDNPEIQEGAVFNVKVRGAADVDGTDIFSAPLEFDVPVTISNRMMEMSANKDELEAETFL